MTPEEYRAYWGLPKDSPMVAPNYAATRSALAKSMGLGQGGRQPTKAAVAPKAPTVRKPRAKKAEA
jgi:predicted transcriptional regulator